MELINKTNFMAQGAVWEREYKNPQLVTKESEPQKDVIRYLKYLKKDEGQKLKNLNILDLGSGTGRNSNYLANLGNNVVGLEISPTAINIAKTRAKEMGVNSKFILQNFGSNYPFDNNFFDIAIDITSSNSLNETERDIYLQEVNRVLNNKGYFFVKTLCKDGDKNAGNLLKKNPGKEKDTYINQDMGLTERVFSKKDFIDLYSKYFEITQLNKKTSYTRFKGQSYKRNFWLAYLKKL